MNKFLFDYAYILSMMGGEKVAIIFSIAISLIIIFWQKERLLAEFVLLNYFLTISITMILKNIVAKPRNPLALIHENSYAFPSAHTSLAMTTFLLLFFIANRFIKNNFWKITSEILAVFWLISIIFARLYLRVHDIYDIIGGILVAIIIYYIIKKIKYFKFVKIK